MPRTVQIVVERTMVGRITPGTRITVLGIYSVFKVKGCWVAGVEKHRFGVVLYFDLCLLTGHATPLHAGRCLVLQRSARDAGAVTACCPGCAGQEHEQGTCSTAAALHPSGVNLWYGQRSWDPFHPDALRPLMLFMHALRRGGRRLTLSLQLHVRGHAPGCL
jgi:hypothetical protein